MLPVNTYLKSKGLSSEEIREMYEIMKSGPQRPVNRIISEIKDAVCLQLMTDREKIYLRTRKKQIFLTRYVIGYFLFKNKLCNLSEIATCFQSAISSYTTVIYGNKVVSDTIDSNFEFRHHMEVLEQKINEIINR